jgi:hypothetical protein
MLLVLYSCAAVTITSDKTGQYEQARQRGSRFTFAALQLAVFAQD